MSECWVYAAVSSAAQESTVDDQEKWAQETARQNGWTITRTFRGVSSGARGVRRLLADLVADLRQAPKAERPARILMLRLDRIGRGRLADSLVVLRELEDLGVSVFTRDGGEESIDGPMRELITAAKFAVAAFENEVRREKSLAFHARKKAAGEYASLPPFGFVFIEKILTIYEPEAKIVRELYERRVGGWGWQRLAQYAAKRAPPKLRPNGEMRKLSWGMNTVSRILENERYRGTIIPEGLWDDAVAMKGQRLGRRAIRWPWPLRGAVRCTCGGMLLGEASGREGNRNQYYVCRRFNAHSNPSYPHHPANKLEAQFVEILRMLEPGDTPPYGDPTPKLDGLRRQRADLATRRAEIEQRRTRAWELAEDARIPRADLAGRLEALNADSIALSDSIRSVDREFARAESQANSQADVAQAFAGMPALWPKLTVEFRRDVAIAVAAYLGGLYADPAEPGVLKFRPFDEPGSQHSVERVWAETLSGQALEATVRSMLAAKNLPNHS